MNYTSTISTSFNIIHHSITISPTLSIPLQTASLQTTKAMGGAPPGAGGSGAGGSSALEKVIVVLHCRNEGPVAPLIEIFFHYSSRTNIFYQVLED